jgi:hypothetical protein
MGAAIGAYGPTETGPYAREGPDELGSSGCYEGTRPR